MIDPQDPPALVTIGFGQDEVFIDDEEQRVLIQLCIGPKRFRFSELRGPDALAFADEYREAIATEGAEYGIWMCAEFTKIVRFD